MAKTASANPLPSKTRAFLKGLDEPRLRQIAQEMHADGLRAVGHEDRARILGG
jgi:hypothetical protein